MGSPARALNFRHNTLSISLAAPCDQPSKCPQASTAPSPEGKPPPCPQPTRSPAARVVPCTPPTRCPDATTSKGRSALGDSGLTLLRTEMRRTLASR